MKSNIEEVEVLETQPDVGMPFEYPRISIPGPAHYGGGLAQGLKD
jgi:hypothetical protein